MNENIFNLPGWIKSDYLENKSKSEAIISVASSMVVGDIIIDIEALVNSALLDKCLDLILNDLNILYNKNDKIDLYKYEIKQLDEKEGFIIANTQIGTLLRDMKDFESINILDRLNNFRFYKIGKWNKLEVYIDPYFEWDNTQLLIVKNNFFNYKLGKIKKEDYFHKMNVELSYINPDVELYNIKK